MRHSVLLGLCVAVGASAYAQETQVSQHPSRPVAGVSAFRYYADPMVCPPGTDDATIPESESRRLLCEVVESPLLNKKVEQWVDFALGGTSDLNKDDVFVTYMEICRENNGPPHFGHYNGNNMQVAAGVARLFYGTALYWQHQSRGIGVDKNLENDLYRMLNKGDNYATARLVNYMTNTQSGGALGGRSLSQFAQRRDLVNMFFVGCLGFENFNVNQKVWLGMPSPRDMQLLGEKLPINYENSNRVTTNQVAALLYLIDQQAIISCSASKRLKEMMYQPVEQQKVSPLQAIGDGLPVGAKYWGVKGYTRMNFHDAAIVSLPNGKHYVLVAFSKYNNYPTTFINKLSEIVANRQMTKTGDNDRRGDYLRIPKSAGE